MPERDPLVGRRFYDFVVEKKLAQGGMGAVYLMQHERFPIRKVLKVILPEYADRPDIRERFEREAHAVARLKHSNIVSIDSVGVIDGQPCMLIPFLEGQPLDEYLVSRGGRLSARDALHIAVQTALGLDHAHRHGIIHRDLKPGNVFIEPTETDPLAVKVLDFGIAKQLQLNAQHALASLAGPLGTPAYMAVEQFEHARDVTPAADVWALAIMIWEMVTGRRPWDGPNAHVLYHKQLTEPPEPPTPGTLSPAWEDLLRKALSPNPALRPQSMAALVVPLALALPTGTDVLKSIAPMWLPEGRSELATAPIAAPPAAPPVWAPAHAAMTHQPSALPTTIGSANGVVEQTRPASAIRWRVAILGVTAAVLSGAGVYAVAGRGDHVDTDRRNEAARPSAPPTAQMEARPPSALPPTGTAGSQTAAPATTRIPAPQSTADTAASSTPPSIVGVSPSREAATLRSTATSAVSPPLAPLRSSRTKPPAAPASDATRSSPDSKPAAIETPSAGTRVPAAPSRPTPPSAKPDTARKFDPNAAGGQ